VSDVGFLAGGLLDLLEYPAAIMLDLGFDRKLARGNSQRLHVGFLAGIP
jgi:hypothetical protein